jgi:hypothetical protein
MSKEKKFKRLQEQRAMQENSASSSNSSDINITPNSSFAFSSPSAFKTSQTTISHEEALERARQDAKKDFSVNTKQENIPEEKTDFTGIDVTQGMSAVSETDGDGSFGFVAEHEPIKEEPKKSGLFGSKKKSKEKKPKGLMDAPKTVQQTIPYTNVYSNGIIETMPGNFTKSYLLHDVNFKTAADEEQETIFSDFGNLLNTFGADVKAEITIFNRNIDQEKFKENTLLKMQGDKFDSYREEYNQILIAKINEGRNNIIHEKYLTIGIEATGIDEAVVTFSRLDSEIGTRVKKINGVETLPMTTEERMSLFYDICRNISQKILLTDVPMRVIMYRNGC